MNPLVLPPPFLRFEESEGQKNFYWSHLADRYDLPPLVTSWDIVDVLSPVTGDRERRNYYLDQRTENLFDISYSPETTNEESIEGRFFLLDWFGHEYTLDGLDFRSSPEFEAFFDDNYRLYFELHCNGIDVPQVDGVLGILVNLIRLTDPSESNHRIPALSRFQRLLEGLLVGTKTPSLVEEEDVTLFEALLRACSHLDETQRQALYGTRDLFKVVVDGMQVIKSRLELIVPASGVVDGNLDFSYGEVPFLPEGLVVTGNLDLTSSLVTALPARLSVGGDLRLAKTSIAELPPGLIVRGSLDLRFSMIRQLPDPFLFQGSLRLEAPVFATLPRRLEVGGDLTIDEGLFDHLDSTITVGGDLFWRGPSPRTWNGSLTVAGNAHFDHETSVLPPLLDVGGNLGLRRTRISSLPEGIRVGGNLDLSKTKIAELPKNFTLGGGLDLSGTRIKALPKNLRVSGSLNLTDSWIEALPEIFAVGGDLSLKNTAIEDLPRKLFVEGAIDLSNTLIQTLGHKTYFKGDLSLRDSLIQELPEGLRVEGSLFLGENTRQLPEGLCVGGALNFGSLIGVTLPVHAEIGEALFFLRGLEVPIPPTWIIGGRRPGLEDQPD